HGRGEGYKDRTPDTSTGEMRVTANALSGRRRPPPMNGRERKTAASDKVIDRMVKPISFAPATAASNTELPLSMCRTMFSSTTIASSTTNPTESVSAIKDKLSKE